MTVSICVHRVHLRSSAARRFPADAGERRNRTLQLPAENAGPLGGIGRRAGFKILCPKGRIGSTPIEATCRSASIGQRRNRSARPGDFRFGYDQCARHLLRATGPPGAVGCASSSSCPDGCPMNTLGFPPDNPLMRCAVKARNAMQDLHMGCHDASVKQGVGR